MMLGKFRYLAPIRRIQLVIREKQTSRYKTDAANANQVLADELAPNKNHQIDHRAFLNLPVAHR